MPRGPFPACSSRHGDDVAGPERPSGRTAYPSGSTPSTITSPTGCTAGSRTEIRPGARAHHTHLLDRAQAPPSRRTDFTEDNSSRLTRDPDTDKEQPSWRV